MLNPTSIALQIEVENTKGPMVWTFFDLPPDIADPLREQIRG